MSGAPSPFPPKPVLCPDADKRDRLILEIALLDTAEERRSAGGTLYPDETMTTLRRLIRRARIIANSGLLASPAGTLTLSGDAPTADDYNPRDVATLGGDPSQ